MQAAVVTPVAPPLVRFSSALLWAALAAGFLLQLIYADWNPTEAVRTLLGGLVLVFALHAYLIVGIAKGRRSARWIYLMFFLGALAISPPNIAEFALDPAVVGTELGQVLLQAIAFPLLFTPKANTWFKQATRQVSANEP
jgi:hypothetical protein